MPAQGGRAPREVGVVDVAKRAGVSLGTVSNVLNRPDIVGVATRERVQAAIDELGFVRNEAARQLRAGRSRTIGLVVLDVGNPFFTDVAAGVEQSATESNLSVVLCNSSADAERESHYLSLLQEQRAYGILITPIGPNSRQIEQIRRGGTKVVFVDRPGTRRHCSVAVDDIAGGALAAAHLVAIGHKRLAFVGGPLSTSQVSDRLAGAQNASPRAIKVFETSDMTVAAGRAAGEQIADMPANRRPTALFCANDLIALGVLQVMTQRGLRVPDDFALVGYDDIEFAGAAAVPLTSVRQPRELLGRTAADLLIDEVTANDHRHRQVVFEPELTVRASTDPAASSWLQVDDLV